MMAALNQRLETRVLILLAVIHFVLFFRSKLGLFQSRISLQKASVKVRELTLTKMPLMSPEPKTTLLYST